MGDMVDGRGLGAGTPRTLLVVCTANVCRSPLAAALLQRQSASTGISVTSAGVRALDGSGMCEVSSGELERRGRATPHHIAREVTRGDVETAGLVVAMEREHRSSLVRLAPGSQAKVFTLLEAVGLARDAAVAGITMPSDLTEVARVLHGRRGLAQFSSPVPQRRWFRKQVEPEDPLTIVDGHGLSLHAHEAAAAAVALAAEELAALLLSGADLSREERA